jgi:sec-independent protein translocase protein TatB
VFDLSLTKLGVLALIALVVFGPNELPRLARQAGRMLRDLRRIAEAAKADLREGLGPEFQDFDFDDLSPRRFVQKHLMDEPAPDVARDPSVSVADAMKEAGRAAGAEAGGSDGAAQLAGESPAAARGGVATLEAVDIRPPFDLEAT